MLVIGAGGLGSASVPYLVGAGIGTIGIVDDDAVELSNLHRQIAHGTADIGRQKTASLADTARAIDPAVNIIEHGERLTSANARHVFSGYDLVIDGSDNFPTRYLANDAAQLVGIPLVWGAILQFHGQVGVAWHEHGPGYRDLFPQPPAPGDVVNCADGGVLPGLCGTVGSLLATEAMKLIAGIGEPLIGRVLLYDALTARTRELAYQRDPDGATVSELIDYELFCGEVPVQFRAPAVTAVALRDELAAGTSPRLLDVRTREEWEVRHIPGAVLLPLAELEALAENGSPLPTGPITVHCAHDGRSIRAAEVLLRQGVHDVRYLRGGIEGFVGVAPEYVTESL